MPGVARGYVQPMEKVPITVVPLLANTPSGLVPATRIRSGAPCGPPSIPQVWPFDGIPGAVPVPDQAESPHRARGVAQSVPEPRIENTHLPTSLVTALPVSKSGTRVITHIR